MSKAIGGKIAQDKLYSCPMCGSMGRGSRFVEHHLMDGCKGVSKRAKKNAQLGVYKGREQEAQLNTAIFNANRMKAAELESYKQMRDQINADIKRMKEMGEYVKTIF
mgnify:CR=1 FL=1|jgi:hypothetical protein